MEIELVRAGVENAREIQAMQLEAFRELLDKYQDFTYYYFICMGQQKVGAIRIVDKKEAGKNKRISPIFILPRFQDRGIAQRAIQMCEEMHGKANWELDTILQEEKNCCLYDKMGYRRTGKTRVVNERLILVFYEKE